jgi:hypothetical protein
MLDMLFLNYVRNECNTHTFTDILNSPEYTDKIETLFPAQPAQRIRLLDSRIYAFFDLNVFSKSVYPTLFSKASIEIRCHKHHKSMGTQQRQWQWSPRPNNQPVQIRRYKMRLLSMLDH